MFQQKTEALFARMGEHQVMCLATGSEGRVTARSMSVILVGEKLYFQTDRRMTKYRQLSAEPRAALCWQNVQLEGVCRELGHPLLAENQFFAERYQRHFASSYQKYSAMPDERLFEFSPTLISVWDYENGLPYQEFFDFAAQQYRRADYSCQQSTKAERSPSR